LAGARGYSKCSVQAEVSAMMAALGWHRFSGRRYFQNQPILLNLDGNVIFQAYTTHGYQLWKTDARADRIQRMSLGWEKSLPNAVLHRSTLAPTQPIGPIIHATLNLPGCGLWGQAPTVLRRRSSKRRVLARGDCRQSHQFWSRTPEQGRPTARPAHRRDRDPDGLSGGFALSAAMRHRHEKREFCAGKYLARALRQRFLRVNVAPAVRIMQTILIRKDRVSRSISRAARKSPKGFCLLGEGGFRKSDGMPLQKTVADYGPHHFPVDNFLGLLTLSIRLSGAVFDRPASIKGGD
jgi:hypothetical protein